MYPYQHAHLPSMGRPDFIWLYSVDPALYIHHPVNPYLLALDLFSKEHGLGGSTYSMCT